jgi:glycosyltransferase involved in cell wall biosynthesis
MGCHQNHGEHLQEKFQFQKQQVHSYHSKPPLLLLPLSHLQFEVWDTHKFAQYIIAALEYKGLQSSVIESNAKSLKAITWEHCAEEVLQVYQKLC